MRLTSDSALLLLDWVLRRGRQLLRLQVARLGERYQVSIVPLSSMRGPQVPLHVHSFSACPTALQRHARLVAAFREAGWTSVSYR